MYSGERNVVLALFFISALVALQGRTLPLFCLYSAYTF